MIYKILFATIDNGIMVVASRREDRVVGVSGEKSQSVRE